MTIFGREPVTILAAVNAALALGVGFGLDVTGEQQALIATAVSAVIALIARKAVTPNATVEENVVTAVRVARALPPFDDIPATGSPTDD